MKAATDLITSLANAEGGSAVRLPRALMAFNKLISASVVNGFLVSKASSKILMGRKSAEIKVPGVRITGEASKAAKICPNNAVEALATVTSQKKSRGKCLVPDKSTPLAGTDAAVAIDERGARMDGRSRREDGGKKFIGLADENSAVRLKPAGVILMRDSLDLAQT